MGVVVYLSACWHALAACLCGPDKIAAAGAAHEHLSSSHSAKTPLLGPTAANGRRAVQQQQQRSSKGSKAAAAPPPEPRMTRKSYGLNGLEKRLERKFSGMKVRVRPESPSARCRPCWVMSCHQNSRRLEEHAYPKILYKASCLDKSGGGRPGTAATELAALRGLDVAEIAMVQL